MISVQEATARILSHTITLETEVVSLDNAIGKVLAESVRSDRDLPPFDRVTMDGIAIAYKSWLNGKRTFDIIGTQAAGQPQSVLSNEDAAFEVMTGAILPQGADTVLRYEDIRVEDKKAHVLIDEITKGQNIHWKGQDAKQNETLLNPSSVISATEIALLASVGKSKISVCKFPKTVVISTGDELVDVHEIPLPHQIRRSNTYALQASMKAIGWESDRFHFPDDQSVLLKAFQNLILQYNVLIISGGVSQGKYDFIPEVLQQCGIEKVFHKVNQKPGKPFWFGYSKEKTVFALPGNPVSTFMCMHRYIIPWIKKNMKLFYQFDQVVLAKDFSSTTQMTYFLQVQIRNEDGCLKAYPKTGGGSGDFANLQVADGFLELPPDREEFKAGEVFSCIRFRH